MNMTIEEVVTEMTMSYSHKMHLLLEGDSDVRLLSSMLGDEKSVNFVCVYGGDRVIEAVDKVERDVKLAQSLKVLGIIDRDYRVPLNRLPSSSNILITDHRDIECMMLDSPTFSHVLRDLGSIEKIRVSGGIRVVKQHILNAGKTLGELRYFSQYSKSHWNFKKLDVTKFIDKRTMVVDCEKLVAHVRGLQTSTYKSISADTLSHAKVASDTAKCVKNTKYFAHDFLICRGHDVMAVLGYALRSYCGSISTIESSIERLETLFRVGFLPYSYHTALFKRLKHWVIKNGLDQDVYLV